jgi:hypothetical protein
MMILSIPSETLDCKGNESQDTVHPSRNCDDVDRKGDTNPRRKGLREIY